MDVLVVSQCFPGCLTIQIRTALCILIVLLIYAVAQACVVSNNSKWNCKLYNALRKSKALSNFLQHLIHVQMSTECS